MPTPEHRRPWRSAVLGVLLGVLVGQSVMLLLLGRSVASYQHFWTGPQGQSGGLLYVALGDSAAQGVGASRPLLGYVGLVAQDLRRASGQRVQVVNLSVSGARVADVRRQVAELRRRGLDPDLVTVDVGGNDVRAGYDATRFAREVEALAAVLPAGSVVLDVPWFMHGSWERHAREAARVVRDAAGRHGLAAAPLHEAQRSQGWGSMLTLFAPDLFHPDDEGYRLWARTAWVAAVRSGVLSGLCRPTTRRTA